LPKATIALVTRYSLLITLSVVASVDKQKKKIFSKIAPIRTSPGYGDELEQEGIDTNFKPTTKYN